MSNFPIEYKNGGYYVKFNRDGSKKRYKINDNPPVFPETIDLKITNYCDLANLCTYCHESSDKDGEAADIENITSLLEILPSGTEVAIGGGDPLSFVPLNTINSFAKSKGIITNITLNELHTYKTNTDKDFLNLNNFYGIGISYRLGNIDRCLDKIIKNKNAVWHLILGVNSVADMFDLINKLDNPSFLILGYKSKGRGEHHFDENENSIKKNINEWREYLDKIPEKVHLSFDNLAIDQLNLKERTNEEKWNKRYLGEEGEFSMYIDMVKEEFATSSFSDKRFDFNYNIKEAFAKVREVEGHT